MALYGNYRLVDEFGRRLRDTALLGGVSLLDGRPIWNADNFAELDRCYCQQPDDSADTFDTKLRRQLAGASPDAVQLFAELYAVHFAALGNVTSSKKLVMMDILLDIAESPIQLLESTKPTYEGAAFLREVFTHGGVLNGGPGYNISRWRQMQHLVYLGRAWCALPDGEKRRILADPEGLADSLHGLVPDDVREPQIEKVLLYLLAPDFYVPICSSRHLAKILSAFPDKVPPGLEGSSPQRQASAIRDALRRERGEEWDFYDDREEWDASTAKAEPPSPRTPAQAVDAPEDAPGGALPEFTAQDASNLLVPEEWLGRVRGLLQRRRQVVFQGPPGTGKTYLARKIAARLAGTSKRVRLVQFHPAYTYEDFFEGFRPTPEGRLELRPGPLRLLAEEAEEQPELNFFLVIDEINRGNLAKIFGELYFLLEYRSEGVQLMYSQQRFTLPENLFIIATMNSADRSIALVDAAMRRRFAFLDLDPGCEPTAGLLGRYCRRAGVGGQLDALWRELNRRVRERNPESQVGPSYLMSEELTASGQLDMALLAEIWETEVLPQLRESFYGDEEWVDRELSLAALTTGWATPEGAN
ncbi:AAA family ATPase [Dermabacteraceae bacterium TAE3-ERU5]|nr:AAA family ATPase [Dermabacteraceae bacterium TAE3-ERU5]